MTPPDRLRVAVIGVGHLGKHHARLLGAMPDVELVAVADIDAARAAAAAAATGARVVCDARELLGVVDAVSIAVPTEAHLQVARPFLERGTHVLVEKPIASTVAEAEEMVAAAHASGATLAVGHTERFNPGFIAARPHLRAPKFIEVHRLSPFPERSLDIDVIFDLMVHDLDIILAVDGTDVTSVDAVGVPVLSGSVDICSARLRFASGATANLTASRISHDRVRKARFFQPDLYVSVDFAAQSAAAWRVEAGAADRASIQGGSLDVVKVEPLHAELADFVAAARDRRDPLVTGRDGLRALALASRISDACRT
ncbi:MAG TPA: Gfo/Idh/MocA family oxidoreductase [Vicinamibacterales bacterium]|nr:Gfo/Idh/MocA family oxidoreductase [Vicinamibacterales bacterium]